MGMKGTFEGDFSSLATAVDGAVIKLRSFEAGSEQVSDALSKVGESFSGTKVIQQATLMAEVFTRAGGSATFTEKELARMGATGSEAVEKLRAMGKDVPPGIARIAAETRDVTTAHSPLLGIVKEVAIGFAAMFTARAAFNFITSTVQEASALKDLSQQTRIGVEELQQLAGAIAGFGVNADELGKGLFTLSRKIAGDPSSVATSLALMGFSIKDVEGLNGKELFLKIESGLATLQGGLRDTAASDLFGSKLGMAMAGASEGMAAAMAASSGLTVQTRETNDALAAFGQNIETANRNISAMAANLIGPVAQGFNVLYDATTKGASKWSLFVAGLKDQIAFELGGTGTEHLAKLLDDLSQKTESATVATQQQTAAHVAGTVAMTEQGRAAQFMATLEENASGVLSAAQLKNLAHLKEIGALNAANAAGVGVNAAQYARYTVEIAKAEAAAKKLADAEDDYIELQRKRLADSSVNWASYEALKASLSLSSTDAITKNIDRWVAKEIASHQLAKTDTADFYAWVIAQEKLLRQAQDQNTLLAHESSKASFQKRAIEAADLYAFMLAHSDQFYLSEIHKQRDIAREAQQAAAQWRAGWDPALDSTIEKASLAGEAIAAFGRLAVGALDATGREIEMVIDMFGDLAVAAGEANRRAGWTTVVKAKPVEQITVTGGHYSNIPMIRAWIERLQNQIDAFGNGPVGGTSDMFVAAQRLAALQSVTNAVAQVEYLRRRLAEFQQVPGAADGGVVQVGERGAELVRLPSGSQVFPNGSGPNQGGPTIAAGAFVFNLYGTPAALVAQVKAALTTSILQSTKIGMPS